MQRISSALSTAGKRPDVEQGWFRADASAESHRQGYNRWVNAAGIDSALAQEMYATLSDPTDARFAADTERTFRTLKAAGLKVAVISDIHFDLRPGFVKNDLDGYIDHFVLSFEQGICKPDPTIFRVALDALGVQPCEALMVGDRSGYDGAAVEAGVATLLVPPLTQVSHARLHLVSAACGISSPDGSARGPAFHKRGPPLTGDRASRSVGGRREALVGQVSVKDHVHNCQELHVGHLRCHARCSEPRRGVPRPSACRSPASSGNPAPQQSTGPFPAGGTRAPLVP